MHILAVHPPPYRSARLLMIDWSGGGASTGVSGLRPGCLPAWIPHSAINAAADGDDLFWWVRFPCAFGEADMLRRGWMESLRLALHPALPHQESVHRRFGEL